MTKLEFVKSILETNGEYTPIDCSKCRYNTEKFMCSGCPVNKQKQLFVYYDGDFYSEIDDEGLMFGDNSQQKISDIDLDFVYILQIKNEHEFDDLESYMTLAKKVRTSENSNSNFPKMVFHIGDNDFSNSNSETLFDLEFVSRRINEVEFIEFEQFKMKFEEN